MRVAFVHDFLTQFGGAERVLLEYHRLYPDAPIYTSIFVPNAFGTAFEGIEVRTTWLQRLPGSGRYFRALVPLYPQAFESLDLSAFDLVLSTTTSFAKGVRTPLRTLHVCYMHTPTRFLWSDDERVRETVPALARPLFRAAVPALRRWDLAAARRPGRVIANSRNVAERIRRVYGRDSDVVPCPASLDGFSPSDATDDYFLVASRLLAYKRIDLAVAACARIGAPLVVVGEGPDEQRLRGLADGNTRFLGRVDDDARRRLFARARALIVPGEEDFGLVPIEAAASGRPTVAFAAGGALETVVEGATGIFFREPSAEALASALRSLSQLTFDRSTLVARARAFSPNRFREDMRALIDRYLAEWQPA